MQLKQTFEMIGLGDMKLYLVLKSHIGKKGSLFVNEYIFPSYYLKLQDDRLSHYTTRNLVHFDLIFSSSVQIN